MASNQQEGVPSDEQLRAKYPGMGNKKGAMNSILAKRMQGQGQKHFDSADWQMSKNGAGVGQKPIYNMGSAGAQGMAPRQMAPAATLGGFKKPPLPDHLRKSALAGQAPAQNQDK